ncbi:MAG: hypothetical protein JXR95_16450 [Deltaproteobacteria bacterium]|nr:hypothetical protein [Deltaproteobacteria bacterium]
MKQFLILLTVMVATLGCSDKKSSDNEPDKKPIVEKKKVVPEKKNLKTEKKTPETMKAVNKEVSLPICDKYIKYVCSCSDRIVSNELLKSACELAKKSLPAWKKSAGINQTVFDSVAQSCQDAIYNIKSTGQCGEIK